MRICSAPSAASAIPPAKAPATVGVPPILSPAARGRAAALAFGAGEWGCDLLPCSCSSWALLLWVRHSHAPKPARVEKRPVVSGVGLNLSRDQNTQQFIVKKTLPNSPAEAAGIASGLVLSKVDGVAVEEKTLNEVSALLRGKAGTKVALELIDPENGTTNQVELTRSRFENRSR